MPNDTKKILEKVRLLSVGERRRFASHKSKAINRKDMAEEDAIYYAWERLGIIETHHNQTPLPHTAVHKKKRSWLDRWIKEGT